MNVGEATSLFVDAIRETASARRERDAFRRLAVASLAYAHEQHAEIERLRARNVSLINELRREHREAA
jgi:hypothetical protein